MELKKTDPKDDSIFEMLTKAGLTIKNIVLLNPQAIEVCVDDKKFLKGMPDQYMGKKITYVYMNEDQIREIRIFRASLTPQPPRKQL